MWKKRLWGLALLLVAVGLLLGQGGCGTLAPPKNNGTNRGGDITSGTLKIVSSLPRTGSAKAQTDTIVNGIKMAFEEIGYKVGNFTIQYQDWDDATAGAGQWTAEAEGSNASKAAQDPEVMVYIGPYNSGAAAVSMPILNQAGLLMISPANTAPELTKPGFKPGEPAKYRPTGKINYTRVVPTDDLQGAVGAQFAFKDLGVKTVYVLDDNEVYGKGIANLFVQECESLGITVLGRDSINTKESEFKSLMNTIKAKNPDLVYFGGTTQSKGGQIARDLAGSGLKAKLMVPDGCYEFAFIEAAGAANVNDRCYVTFGGMPVDEQLKTPHGKKFVESYRKKFASNPEAYAIYGYEAAKVAIAAITKAGKRDRAAIVEAALGLKDFEGALGRWSFDKNGDTTLTTMSVSKVHDGKFQFVKVMSK